MQKIFVLSFFTAIIFTTATHATATASQMPEKQSFADRISHAIKNNAVSTGIARVATKGKDAVAKLYHIVSMPIYVLVLFPLWHAAIAIKYRCAKLPANDLEKIKKLEKQTCSIAEKMGTKNSNMRIFFIPDPPQLPFCKWIMSAPFLTFNIPYFPTILLNKRDWEKLTKEEQDFVLAHETAHTTQRWDHYLPALVPYVASKLAQPIFHKFLYWLYTNKFIKTNAEVHALSFGYEALKTYYIFKYVWNVLRGSWSRRLEKRADLLAVKALGTSKGGMSFFAKESDINDSLKNDIIKWKGVTAKKPQGKGQQQLNSIIKNLTAIPISDAEKNQSHPPDIERIIYMAEAEQARLVQAA